MAVTWWSSPIDGALSSTRGSLSALVLGVALGLIIRRPVPAMALTLAVFTFVQIAVPLWVRPHLVAAVEKTVAITSTRLDSVETDGPGAPLHISVTTGDHDDWILTNQTVDSTGQPAAVPEWLSSCLPGPPPSPVEGRQQVRDRSDVDDCFARLADEGYRQRVVYQPASNFCFWWIRRVS